MVNRDDLKGARLFVTGGTGLIGRWLLESFVQQAFEAEMVVLTRNPGALAFPQVSFLEGDICDFKYPEGEFSHVIHAAASIEGPQVFRSIVDGTENVLEFAAQKHVKHFLFLSSGAVYGHAASGTFHEDSPILPQSVYGEAKVIAEKLCVEGLIARVFACIGPHLPVKYALGNFIQSCLEERPIQIQGDGTAVRSYIYASDLVHWLWTILLKGTPLRPYNVGGSQAISIADLARLVAGIVRPGTQIIMLGQPGLSSCYVPDISRAKLELGLEPTVGLESAIARTANVN